MKHIYIAVILALLFSNICFAQASGHEIKITSSNYDKEYVVIGYYYGDRQLVQDTILRNGDNAFVLSGEEPLSEGVYLLLLRPNNRYIQFIVNKDEQHFEIALDTTTLGDPIITGSPDNQLFLDYVGYLNQKGEENQGLSKKIEAAKSTGADITGFEDRRKALDVQVKEYQRKLVAENPTAVTAKLVGSTREIVIPDFEGAGDEVKTKQYLYYKKHYFDYLDLGQPTFLRTPFMHNKIDSYIQKLTPQAPDSIIIAVDYLLDQMSPAPETFQFYLSYFLNKYAASKVVGHDGIYVHLIDEYYAKGKADWVTEENLREIVAEANKVRPTLLGKNAQDIKVYRKDNSPISLSDIKSKYVLLYFWAPDCGHCKKATPHVVDFYKKYKDSLDVDIEVLAVCSKIRDEEKIKDCWDAVDEKGMNLWINGTDLNHASRFKLKYNVQTTPSIFILDQNREIIMKKIGAEYLDEVMQEIIRVDDLKAIEEQQMKE